MNKLRILGAMCAVLFTFPPVIGYAASVSGQGTWETTLLARDFDGVTSTIEGYYDTVLDITWLADANTNGQMNWADATAWAAGLTVGGVGGWRLPTSEESLCSGYNCTSELDSLFISTLGNTSGGFINNTGPFANVQAFYYWSSTEYAPDITRYALSYYFRDGNQGIQLKTGDFYAWAVHSGDVGAGPGPVPVPAAVWLFGSGLLGLIGVARCKKA